MPPVIQEGFQRLRFWVRCDRIDKLVTKPTFSKATRNAGSHTLDARIVVTANKQRDEDETTASEPDTVTVFDRICRI
jgi:hypothetical protein